MVLLVIWVDNSEEWSVGILSNPPKALAFTDVAYNATNGRPRNNYKYNAEPY